ncbi:MAG: EAL domain-containing protein, partial [Pseudomonadota bacterium]|nr:EAL domain-containing protein [Pseudomonadota bacterium]
PELTTGRHLSDIVPLLVHQAEPADTLHIESMLQAGTRDTESRELRTLDGRIIIQRRQPVAQGAHGRGCIWFHDDITLERQTQQRAHLALHDPLTALLNRRGLYESLQTAIAHAAVNRTPVALLYIDLDDFKHANDVGGHRTGDEILVAVARTLAGQMRKGELVARLGGDEFAVLCPGVEATDPGLIAARLVEAVSALRFDLSMNTLRVGCSIGIATYPTDARTEDDLVACADAAMYEAKQSGKNGWAAYHNDPLRSQAESARVNWNARIHRALQDGRFVLHFQSVHRAFDLRVAHHEALVRMVDENDPTRVIAPADFVLHAERSGKIRQIDRWVFEACAGHLAGADPAACIAANLSARSLEDASFPGFLRDVLQRLDVDPRRLHIELTETSAISDPLSARHMIDELRNLGCAVHLDDFGSGFSSFAHLKLLDVEAIKIDGAFIRNLQSDSSNRLFVASMIDIAHNLNKIVVAEHVEDAGTLDILRTLGVDLVQGFHLGRPSARLLDARPRGRMQVVADSRRRPHN